MNYVLHILIYINIYAILALSINLIVGYTGLLTLAHAAFYGIGAYSYTLLTVKLGIPFLPALLSAIAIVFILSYLFSFPLLKLKGDSFILGTLGFQIIIFTLLYNWTKLTRGPYGIPGIPKPTIFGLSLNPMVSFFLFSSFIMALVLFLFIRIHKSPFARVLKAIREDQLSVASLGRNVASFKRQAFVIGSTLATLSGFLFAVYVTYIDPTSFTLDESIFILSIALIGGTGNIIGPIAGAIFMILLPEILRFVGIPDAVAANLRQIIYGLLLILVMRLRPNGFLGEMAFKK